MKQNREKQRLSLDGGVPLGVDNPFAALSGLELPSAPASNMLKSATHQPRKRGSVRMRRLTAGRGGKVVTELFDFDGVHHTELPALLKQLKANCGVGGTLRDGALELQGDQRSYVQEFFNQLGVRVISCGG
jgi:translation initiation factor 1